LELLAQAARLVIDPVMVEQELRVGRVAPHRPADHGDGSHQQEQAHELFHESSI
jgi:hypothetical protein